jgi:hypothetical protein
MILMMSLTHLSWLSGEYSLGELEYGVAVGVVEDELVDLDGFGDLLLCVVEAFVRRVEVGVVSEHELVEAEVAGVEDAAEVAGEAARTLRRGT